MKYLSIFILGMLLCLNFIAAHQLERKSTKKSGKSKKVVRVGKHKSVALWAMVLHLSDKTKYPYLRSYKLLQKNCLSQIKRSRFFQKLKQKSRKVARILRKNNKRRGSKKTSKKSSKKLIRVPRRARRHATSFVYKLSRVLTCKVFPQEFKLAARKLRRVSRVIRVGGRKSVRRYSRKGRKSRRSSKRGVKKSRKSSKKGGKKSRRSSKKGVKKSRKSSKKGGKKSRKSSKKGVKKSRKSSKKGGKKSRKSSKKSRKSSKKGGKKSRRSSKKVVKRARRVVRVVAKKVRGIARAFRKYRTARKGRRSFKLLLIAIAKRILAIIRNANKTIKKTKKTKTTKTTAKRVTVASPTQTRTPTLVKPKQFFTPQTPQQVIPQFLF